MLFGDWEGARETGMAITLLAVLYRWSGFGSKPLTARQARFKSDNRSVLALIASLKPSLSKDVKAGVAPHSLRAVDPRSLKELVAAADEQMPIHIHAAAQTREVEECTLELGPRPVEWPLENCAAQ